MGCTPGSGAVYAAPSIGTPSSPSLSRFLKAGCLRPDLPLLYRPPNGNRWIAPNRDAPSPMPGRSAGRTADPAQRDPRAAPMLRTVAYVSFQAECTRHIAASLDLLVDNQDPCT